MGTPSVWLLWFLEHRWTVLPCFSAWEGVSGLKDTFFCPLYFKGEPQKWDAVFFRYGQFLTVTNRNFFMLLYAASHLLYSIFHFQLMPIGFPGESDGKESACNEGDLGSIPESGRSLEKGMAPHSSILPGESHGQKSLTDYSPWDLRVGHHWAANTYLL